MNTQKTVLLLIVVFIFSFLGSNESHNAQQRLLVHFDRNERGDIDVAKVGTLLHSFDGYVYMYAHVVWEDNDDGQPYADFESLPGTAIQHDMRGYWSVYRIVCSSTPISSAEEADDLWWSFSEDFYQFNVSDGFGILDNAVLTCH